jgi:hypothetical protein
MQYIPRDRYQPVCRGFDQNGELIWELAFKEAWQTRMLPVPYRGDLSDQWMRLILNENGIDWEEGA